MTVFKHGEFRLHSGSRSQWKVDCDGYNNHDWTTLAIMVMELLPGPFVAVYGVPRGGIPFATSLQQYVQPGSRKVLIADDVLTTGASMVQLRLELMEELGLPESDFMGVVAHARGLWPDWVTPVNIWGGLLSYIQGAKTQGTPNVSDLLF